MARWAHGWEHWGQSTEGARALFAELVDVDVERVAVGSTVSELVGSVVTALPDGARVAVPEIELTSVLFPLLVQRRLDVRTVLLVKLIDVIADGIDAVAFSAVQMSTGEVADLDAIARAAAAADAITICDATQAAGWLPLQAGHFDAVVRSTYKWLMSPRGSAFLAASERLLDHALPHSAGWYASEDAHSSYSERRCAWPPALGGWISRQHGSHG